MSNLDLHLFCFLLWNLPPFNLFLLEEIHLTWLNFARWFPWRAHHIDRLLNVEFSSQSSRGLWIKGRQLDVLSKLCLSHFGGALQSSWFGQCLGRGAIWGLKLLGPIMLDVCSFQVIKLVFDYLGFAFWWSLTFGQHTFLGRLNQGLSLKGRRKGSLDVAFRCWFLPLYLTGWIGERLVCWLVFSKWSWWRSLHKRCCWWRFCKWTHWIVTRWFCKRGLRGFLTWFSQRGLWSI